MRNLIRSLGLLVFSAAISLAPTASAVTIDWVAVGSVANGPDTTGFGRVLYGYSIARTEVTNAQYTELLNAVAATDTNGLYNTSMAIGTGGITRAGSSGSFTYSVIAGREDMPVNWVTFYDALRFANWLHNGQPSGAQGSSTTEDGSYTITPAGIAANSITRNAEGTIFVPTEDEWYKAAYYDPGSGYFDYPAGTDTPTVCALAGATANTANCDVVGDLTPGGSYTGSASPIGTFDQGGNVDEWNEGITFGFDRTIRGGRYLDADSSRMVNTLRTVTSPVAALDWIGFRVTSVPVSVSLLSPLGLALFAVLLGFAGWWKLRVSGARAGPT